MRLLSRIRTLARIRPLPRGDLPEVAGSVAIILDGNGRWASAAGCRPRPAIAPGARTVRRIVEASIDLGIHDLVGLRVLDRELVAAAGRGRRADGDLRARRSSASCPTSPSRACAFASSAAATARRRRCARGWTAMEDRTELNTRINLWVAFDYGGRAELVEAARRHRRERRRAAGDRRERLRREPLRAGAAGSRSADPHERRAAHLELPACGSSRTRSSSSPTSSGPTSTRATCARAAGGLRDAGGDRFGGQMSNWLSRRRRRGSPACRSCSAPSTSAAGGCSRSSRSRRRRAARVLAARPRAARAARAGGLRRRSARAARRASSTASAGCSAAR